MLWHSHANMIVTYPETALAFWRGEINLLGDEVKCAVMTNHQASKTHQFWQEVEADEAIGAGYEPEGQLLEGPRLFVSGNNAILDAEDPVWDPSSLRGDGAMVWHPMTKRLIIYMTFAEEQSSSNDRFRVKFHATGIMKQVTTGG